MATQEASMEEIVWRSPPHVQAMGGFLHSNNILFYFAESPFFDPTSNNASLAIQATYNEAFHQFIETREAFESRLKTMQGLEFIVSYDPLQATAQVNGQFTQEPSNVWVIRKQNRRKRSGMDDEVVVISTYFIMGDAVYMAPSVASVVGNRILSAVTSLSQLMKTASALPTFTSAYGHTYLPPGARKEKETQLQSQQSKEPTPVPAGPPDSQTERSPGPGGSDESGIQDMRTLAESFSMFSRYGDEFMDESPLLGEPGSFMLSKNGEPANKAAPKGPASAVAAAAGVNTPVPSQPSTPKVRVETPGKSEQNPPSTGSGDKGKKKKRVVTLDA
ncbi:unnamed protein product [Penicillium salamii]|uniref:Mediator of RNA polymerase II transcription subunit 6 n=1 Tax=Penicillium salamii TaxID=1612424 RepID=A0A9W4N664_9EURO|nr:unnamed protein product [Penicillium salamii]CAG8241566.1 unnamed protein product [Penicillium salamii]CAG8258636.1 unnamed protein product [Penicillium salamii]CAG8284567.1 unnamed protein product [Penicillium salamii]CAG8291408.1 unnamed protein product [Penicillium salamii]